MSEQGTQEPQDLEEGVLAQVPPGVPVATVGVDDPRNAAHRAVRILSIA